MNHTPNGKGSSPPKKKRAMRTNTRSAFMFAKSTHFSRNSRRRRKKTYPVRVHGAPFASMKLWTMKSRYSATRAKIRFAAPIASQHARKV